MGQSIDSCCSDGGKKNAKEAHQILKNSRITHKSLLSREQIISSRHLSPRSRADLTAMLKLMHKQELLLLDQGKKGVTNKFTGDCTDRNSYDLLTRPAVPKLRNISPVNNLMP